VVACVYHHDGDDDVPFVIPHRDSNQDPLTMFRLLWVDVANGVACGVAEEFDVDVGAFFS
jgi:hypothetical protein